MTRYIQRGDPPSPHLGRNGFTRYELEAELVPCRKPDCDHLVRATVAYCCAACALAAEHHYEIHDSGPLRSDLPLLAGRVCPHPPA